MKNDHKAAMSGERLRLTPGIKDTRPHLPYRAVPGILPEVPREKTDACCGTPSGLMTPPSLTSGDAPYGHCLQGHVPSPVGPVPRLSTRLTARDYWGGLKVRLGLGRDRYAMPAGLYAVGRPGPRSPVLVTANYKLTVDALRTELSTHDAWILALDTNGINVWCAAGKGTFATDELVHRLKASRLDQVVTHRKLVLPQLGASGVAGHRVKQRTGFQVIWGPIRARDLPAFLKNPQKTPPSMRRMSFTLKERITLVPVEISAAFRPAAWSLGMAMLMALLLGMAGPAPFKTVLHTMLLGVTATVVGLLSGAVLTPILLPWIPGRAFALKGAFLGLAAAFISLLAVYPDMTVETSIALTMMTIATSSFLAMNFTGATPFTSPSGVEREMRWAIPAQALVVTIGLIGWLQAVWAG